MSSIPQYSFELTNFVLGFSAGMIVAIAFLRPRIGQIVARAIGTILLMFGVGLLSWAVFAISTDGAIAAIEYGSILVEDASEVIGWGAGAFFGGIVALWLSFQRLGARD
ncbi:MAG: hypothetical protein FJ276_04990 [Planctomycetes bacterium]|nr:hypothetical protein [Planctomycetota bacterium]